MKPSWAKQEVYDYFDTFLQNSIIGNDSHITDHAGIFTIGNLDDCVKAFVDKEDKSDRDFNAKSQDQFAGYNTEVKIVFAHFIWLWGLAASDITMDGKKRVTVEFLGDSFTDMVKTVFVNGGIGSAGQRHKMKKPYEIAYLLLLFREIKKKLQSAPLKDISTVKQDIETLCRGLYYDNAKTKSTSDDKLRKAGNEYLAMHHILLHLCNFEKYEAIAAQNHKDAIVDTFYSLLGRENTNNLKDDIDESIRTIREKLGEALGRKNVNFYDNDIREAWNFESKGDTSDVALFEYKKAMVFYGPPGTSKTHSAKRLAQLIIAKYYFRNRQNIKGYFENSAKIHENHIHQLQLHSNYNYEDFIAGIHIKDGHSFVKPGFMLDLIEKVSADVLPHVLILDEINRTDISRLFGELFSALEYRNTPIKLSLDKSLEIRIPENLYIVGTMNEIDFSLERVDFALRRRFLWQFKGFDRYVLWDLIQKKLNQLGTAIKEEDMEAFINRCERLNKRISDSPELGENYQIGHTFFAEVVDVFKSMKNIHTGKLNFLKHAVPILWEISVEPILKAFMGNMNDDSKKQQIEELRNMFVNGQG
jgi:5-methylcytosine-specific restriction enzyme B